jgi:hypothetical protein
MENRTMEPHTPSRPDFDHWAALARQDPELFETERSHFIETAIRSAPIQKQHRLRCLQWKLDQIRKTSSTPMVASLLMNRLLWDAVAGKNGLVEQLNKLHSQGNHQQTPPDNAEIIPFPV